MGQGDNSRGQGDNSRGQAAAAACCMSACSAWWCMGSALRVGGVLKVRLSGCSLLSLSASVPSFPPHSPSPPGAPDAQCLLGSTAAL